MRSPGQSCEFIILSVCIWIESWQQNELGTMAFNDNLIIDSEVINLLKAVETNSTLYLAFVSLSITS